MNKPLRFAVMGDMHYVRPEGHQEALSGRPRGVTELVDIKRNLWMTQNVTPRALAAIRELQPDFLIQTGDLIQGHCDDTDGNMQEMAAGLDMIRSAGAPLFFAFGTHDGSLGRRDDEPIKQYLLPEIGRSLGADLNVGYYSFTRGQSLFFVLDYTSYTPGSEQEQFLRSTLAASGKYAHVFIFAHPPLVTLGRPFFTSKAFAAVVAEEAAKHNVDAYFCGHTHNQIASLHKIGERWLPQLQSSVLAYPGEDPVFLTQVRPMLPPPEACELGWSFLEDSAPSWWLVTVDGDQVQVDWHVLDLGVQGQLKWRSGEKARFGKLPPFAPASQSLPELGSIRSMRLRVAGMNCREPEGYSVSLNGHSLGYLQRLEYFDCRQFVDIPSRLWPMVGEHNTLTVTTASEDMCIGGFVLETETDSGWIRSSLVPNLFTNCSRWDDWNVACLQHVSPGQTLDLRVSFTAGEQLAV